MTKFNLKIYRTRRILVVGAALMGLVSLIFANPTSYEEVLEPVVSDTSATSVSNENGPIGTDVLLATTVLEKLEIKGRTPKTGYERTQFYNNWPTVDGCNLRQRIIKRELGESAVLGDDRCTVISGEYNEPYTGSHLVFYQKSDLSSGVQIDHVVALSDAWQKGAQYMSAETRYAMATDPLNLLAVDAKANQGKSDGDAATWLPSNKAFRCTYIARQISVKYKYALWVTQAEHDAMAKVLSACPNEPAVGIEL